MPTETLSKNERVVPEPLPEIVPEPHEMVRAREDESLRKIALKHLEEVREVQVVGVRVCPCSPRPHPGVDRDGVREHGRMARAVQLPGQSRRLGSLDLLGGSGRSRPRRYRRAEGVLLATPDRGRDRPRGQAPARGPLNS